MVPTASSQPRGVDGDAARVGRDRVDEVRAQPRHVREQPLVRGLAQREVQPHLVGRHLEARAELGDVRRQQRRRAARRQRQPDVGRADHLERQRADGLADLGAEHRAADAAHHLLQRAGQRGRLLRHRPELRHRAALAGEHRAHRVDHLAGDRVDQLAPRRQRRLDPLGAAPGLDRRRAGRERAGLVQPELGETHRVEHLLALGGGHRTVAGRRHGLPGHVARQVPVDRAALVRQQLTEPGERRADVAAAAHQGREGVDRLVGTAGAGTRAALVVRRPWVEAEGKVAHVSPHVVARLVAPSGRSGRWCLPAQAAELAGWAHHDRCASHRIDRVLCPRVPFPALNTRGAAMSSPDGDSAGAVRPGRSSRAPRRPVIAVTGAASGLGAAVAARLVAHPDVGKVVGLDDHRGQAEGVTWRVLDIRDPTLASRLGKVDTVVHLAVDTTVDGDRREQGELNVRGTQTVPHRGRRCRRTPGGAVHVGHGLRRVAGQPRCRSPRTHRCVRSRTAGWSRTGWRSSGSARRRPAATPACRSPSCDPRPWSGPASTAC